MMQSRSTPHIKCYTTHILSQHCKKICAEWNSYNLRPNISLRKWLWCLILYASSKSKNVLGLHVFLRLSRSNKEEKSAQLLNVRSNFKNALKSLKGAPLIRILNDWTRFDFAIGLFNSSCFLFIYFFNIQQYLCCIIDWCMIKIIKSF